MDNVVENILCPSCLKTVYISSDNEGQVTCPNCEAYYPLKFAKRIAKFWDTIDRNKNGKQ